MPTISLLVEKQVDATRDPDLSVFGAVSTLGSGTISKQVVFFFCS